MILKELSVCSSTEGVFLRSISANPSQKQHSTPVPADLSAISQATIFSVPDPA